MDEINQRVDQARRRLVLEQWLGRAAWCLFWAWCAAAVALALPKVLVIEGLPEWWTMAWAAGSTVAALVVSLIWTAVSSHSLEDAAIEVDRRYGLRERLASSLLLSDEAQETEAGAALVADAQRAAKRVEVSERFRVQLGRWAWLPLAPALLAFVVTTFVANRSAESNPGEDQQAAATEEEVKKAIEKARKELAKRREEAEKKGLADASKLLKEVESGTKDLAKTAESDRTKAVVKLNDLAKQLEKRKQELGGADALRKQLNEMKDLGKGPADKVAKAMQKGDWKKALEELAKMQQEMASGKVSPEQKQQLAAQLGKMQQKLAQAAQEHKQQMQEMQRQIDEARRKGDLAQAGKLQQKMDQMQQQAPQMQKMQQMAQKMAQAQQALQQGDMQQAADAMNQMAQQMQQMQMEAGAMEMLDAAMTDIEMAKAGMGMQPMPGGQMARDMGMGGFGRGQGPPGMGMGEGQGRGDRPDEENPTNFRDTNVKQNVTQGASTFGGLVRGPSIKGEVVQSIKQELDATHAAPADPLTSERLPKSRQEHAEEYFKNLREVL